MFGANPFGVLYFGECVIAGTAPATAVDVTWVLYRFEMRPSLEARI